MAFITTFEQKVTDYQLDNPRTKWEVTKDGIIKIIAGAVVLLLSAGGIALIIAIAAGGCLFWGFGLVAIVAFFMGIAMVFQGIYNIISSPFKKAKVIYCPGCRKEYKDILEAVTKYRCNDCKTLLLLGPDMSLQPRRRECYYCRMQVAATDDHGFFNCPDCGAVNDSRSESFRSGTIKCPGCGFDIPEEAHICISCGEIIIREPFVPDNENAAPFDMDWVMGKSTRGHFLFGLCMLKSALRSLGVLEGRLDYILLKNAHDRVEAAFYEMEEAFHDKDFKHYMQEYINFINHAYLRLLEAELGYARINKDVFRHDDPEFIKNKKIQDSYGHIYELMEEEKMDPGLKWERNFFDMIDVEKNEEQDTPRYKITKYEHLEKESAIFGKWAERVSLGPVEDIRVPERVFRP